MILMLILIVLIHILICIVLIVLVYIILYIYFCTRIPVSASEHRCSVILVPVICLTFVSTHVHFDNQIQFNSIQPDVDERQECYVKE